MPLFNTQVRHPMHSEWRQGPGPAPWGPFLPSLSFSLPPPLHTKAMHSDRDLKDRRTQFQLSTDIRTCLSDLISIPAPPWRPTSGELSRLCTSCGFLSIQ
ncbi:Hypothetical predicted protein [Marmota monax]|uniref:Uncharacterized protein n=1 Tax=Marmota monax TaxID=9995 RepID=A0A5E4AZ56_MARMO|nr:hypothetical protein GHT09_008111 [Marmota monax]VTJ62743.1 Hypothetical predicted protein [Marmota monax]